MKYFLSVLFFISSVSCLFAQINITGVICEKNTKEIIPYVFIYAENYEQDGVLSDNNGKFSLKVRGNAENIIFTHIAFDDTILPVKKIKEGEKLTVCLKENVQELDEVIVKRSGSSSDKDKVIKEMLRKFKMYFANYLSISKSYLLNLGYYDRTCICYAESVGFLYTPEKHSLDEMIFLPYNSKVSNVCYGKVKDSEDIYTIEKRYSFFSFKDDLNLFHEKGPINKMKNYEFSILSMDADKMNVSFHTKRNHSILCKGTMILDLKNNIISSISITDLLSADCLKRQRKGKTVYKTSKLKIVFKHFNNKIYYKSFDYKVNYNYLKTSKLNNHLYISILFDYPTLLQKPIYKNHMVQQLHSSYSLYGSSLVRIYYNENFWKSNSLFPKEIDLSKIENDLGGKRQLVEQFRNNNLVYEPMTDRFRFRYMDSLFFHKIYCHKMRKEGKNMVKIYDYIEKYRIIDSIVRPVIEEFNNQKEISWTK